MDFLFNPAPAVPAFLSFYDAHEEPIHVSQRLWTALGLSQEIDDSAPTVVISRTPHVRGDESATLKTLVCRAVRDANVQDVSVPKRWLKDYRTLFPQRSSSSGLQCYVSLARPVVLTEVILAARSQAAYIFASTHKAALEERFFDSPSILRQGELYHLSDYEVNGNGAEISGASGEQLEYQLVLASPVLQGLAVRMRTQFYVTLAASANSSVPDLPDALDSPTTSALDEASEDEFEIDEAFLAGSVLQSMPSLVSSTPQDSDVDPSSNGIVNGASSEKLQMSAAWHCSPQSLSRPLSSEWDDSSIYVSTADLSRIGVLNGDWAIARSVSGNSCRLARVCAPDVESPASGVALLSPQLLYNIGAISPLSTDKVYLRPSPFGSHRPAIPTARSLTIARVASPFSTDRTYQPLFLRALQDYFKGQTRLVKQGDIITVKIDTTEVLGLSEAESEGDTDGEFDADHETMSTGNELVYFTVTNIEHNLVSNKGDVSVGDMYVGATVGELGCWVDPIVTRIVQTGLEHSRVPNIAHFLGIRTGVVFSESAGRTSPLLAPESPFDKLLALTAVALNRHAVDYQLPLTILLKGTKGVGKYTTASWVSQRLGIHLYEVDCYDIIGENDAKTEGTLRARFERAASCSPCLFLLRNIDAFSQTTQALEPGRDVCVADTLRDCINDLQQAWKLSGYPVLAVGTTTNAEIIPARITSLFKNEISFEAPGEAERHDILTALLRNRIIAPDISVKDLAVQTAALVASDLVNLVSRAVHASVKRSLKSAPQGELAFFHAGIPLLAADFDIALSESRASYSENIGAPKIPSVSWNDVGGLAHVKADILDTIQLPLEHPELFAEGVKKRSGILLYGPPGTGKTLLAKAVATSCALNFFSVKGPELLNMYIGESEANVRRVFQRARDARPCVIFFDELDSVAPKRGSHGDSGGVMDRIVSQLLAELDGLSGGKAGADVFVIGATNRPDLLDPALLRPGRFDRMLYLGVSKTHEAQLNVLQALTRKFRLDPNLRLEEIAQRCPFHYTGADFYALCADALLKAMSRKAEELETTIAWLNKTRPGPNHPYPLTPQYYLAELATKAETDVLVSQQDFESALDELVPSVSQAEMDHYAQIQQRFSKETINAA